jgi:hypothetical protein
MTFAELLSKYSKYTWLGIASIFLIILSPSFVGLWIHMLLYGILGHTNETTFINYPKIRKTISAILLLIFLYLITVTATNGANFFFGW